MVVQSERTTMDHDSRPSMDEIHLRILRVTEDLRAIQQELNCAAMQAPNDPELMEALSDPPEIDSLQVLKSALDQMRHFLWFYIRNWATHSARACARAPVPAARIPPSTRSRARPTL